MLHIVLFILSTGSDGALVRINSFTLPVGLERVNGSEGERGCGTRVPPLCIVSSGSGGTVSELTDGNFPDPEGTFGPNWAEGFFTVNRRDSSTIEIGFSLERLVVIGEVQLSLLNCPAWGIGAPNIALYGTDRKWFPEGFSTELATQLGNLTSPPETFSCTVQTQTIFSLLEEPQKFQNYYLIINYETNPVIIWFFLGEVQFFEPTVEPSSTLTSITCTSAPCTPYISPPSIVSNMVVTTPPYSTPCQTQPTDVTVPKKGSDHQPPLIAVIAGSTVLLLLCVLAVIFCMCAFRLVRRRRKRNAVKVARVSHIYDDITNFQGGRGEEVVNHEYESIVGAAPRPVGNSVALAKIPVQHNKADAAPHRPSTFMASVESAHYYY